MPEFIDLLDTIGVIAKEARKDLGEDNFYCGKNKKSALISVYDGCGGLGARKYTTFDGHTGAYIASRAVSGAVHDWYHKNASKGWKHASELSSGINEYIEKAYATCSSYAVDNLRIGGSMVRKFPTTMALAYAEQTKQAIRLHVLWAGDSRVYLLDEDGLVQATLDDTDERDALANLTSDSPMTNVLSSDGRYKINCKTIYIDKPTMVFAATDGCFGYIPSPMEFEYEILSALIKADTPKKFSRDLKTSLAEYAGDDLTLGYMSFFFGDFANTKRILGKRLETLEEGYISKIREADTDSCREKLWESYKTSYEKLMD